MKDTAIELIVREIEVYIKHLDAEEKIQVLDAIIEECVFMMNLIDDNNKIE